jgi:hypothetical protein
MMIAGGMAILPENTPPHAPGRPPRLGALFVPWVSASRR